MFGEWHLEWHLISTSQLYTIYMCLCILVLMLHFSYFRSHSIFFFFLRIFGFVWKYFIYFFFYSSKIDGNEWRKSREQKERSKKKKISEKYIIKWWKWHNDTCIVCRWNHHRQVKIFLSFAWNWCCVEALEKYFKWTKRKPS